MAAVAVPVRRLLAVFVGAFALLCPRPVRCAGLLVAALLGWSTVPFHVRSGRSHLRRCQRSDDGFRLLSVNVLCENGNVDVIDELVAAHDPDVVVVVEDADAAADVVSSSVLMSDVWDRSDRLQLLPTQAGAGDVSVFSRLPVLSARLVRAGERQWPLVKVQVGSTPVTVLGAHVTNPAAGSVIKDPGARISAELAGMEQLVSNEAGPLVVAGDFNMSGRSRRLRRLMRTCSLVDARDRWRRPGTWAPVVSRAVPGVLDLDQVLVRDLVCTRVRVVPVAGSDHLAVVTDLKVRSARD